MLGKVAGTKVIICICGALMTGAVSMPAFAQSHNHHPPPRLTLSFDPPGPNISDFATPGTVVATATAAWSNGEPFTGTLMFGQPYGDDGGSFALSCNRCATAKILIDPAGLGLQGDGGTVQNVTIVASQ